MRSFLGAALLGAVVVGLAVASVPDAPGAFSDPLDIDNPYFPFEPYRLKHFELASADGGVHVIDVYLPITREFELADGTKVECACLQEWEIEDGEVIEISLNYFAQADDGTVYYFGETVDVFEDGQVFHDGSWLVGGPKAGDPAGTLTADAPTVIMPGNPEPGDVWKPEDLPDDDLEEFVKFKGYVDAIEILAGTYEDVLKVREKTPAVEFKWYAPGVGFIRSQEASEFLELSSLENHADADQLQDALEELLEQIQEDAGNEG